MTERSWTKRLGILLAVGMIASACSTSSVSPSPAAPTGTTSAATPAASTDAGASAVSAAPAGTAVLKIPSAPVTINVLDVAGNLQLTKQMMENFKAAHPEIVSNVTYATATAPELAGKLQAQQAGGNAQISLVMTGTDGLSAGIKNNLLTKLIPDHQDMFPGLMDNYLAPAADMQGLAQGYGIEVVYYPSGPLIEYNPTKVTTPPTTPAELLAWAKAHPG
ncbi:MAG TPA: extracellular solute-binding protein, partial [Candidatus Limnocylindrales bacterium]